MIHWTEIRSLEISTGVRELSHYELSLIKDGYAYCVSGELYMGWPLEPYDGSQVDWTGFANMGGV